jgi:Zn finger protein HypA/HybF involved in hydrogenase expression
LTAIEDAAAPTPTRCAECHQSVDVHDGSLNTGCERCHGTRSWRSPIRFDHELTAFPLLGLHRLATCEECHATHRFGEAERRCVDCHADVDEHVGRLGGSCETCHNPNAWNRWQFDHDRQTKFGLRGRHVELSCIACHREPTAGAIELSTQCRGCHLNDSRHEGSFGRDCERCHVEESWETIREGARR